MKLLLLLLLTCIPIRAQDILIEYAFESGGHQFKYDLTKEMLDQSPKWSKTENPPLACMVAKNIAELYLRNTLLIRNLEVTSISLLKAKGTDAWYYTITFEPPEGNVGSTQIVQILVLMNGKVVVPIKQN